MKTQQIKQDAYPYNFVTCSQAQTLASSMESGNHNNSLWTVSNTNSKYSDTYGSSWRSKAYGTKSTSIYFFY